MVWAEHKLRQAFQIEHKEDITKQEAADKIAELVDDANRQIKVAQALGYGTKDDYQVLCDSIDMLKKSVGTAGF